MKILCIGLNYAKHIEEMGNKNPGEPVIFMKPQTALTYDSNWVFPTFTSVIDHEIELVIKIDKKAKNISVEQAPTYHSQWALGIDFTARELQKQLRTTNLPWEKAKAFDNAAFVGPFFDKSIWKPQTQFSLEKNQQVVQIGNLNEMIHPIDTLISYASQFFTLEPGDLLFTGTPSGIGPIKKGDILEGYIDSDKQFTLLIQ